MNATERYWFHKGEINGGLDVLESILDEGGSIEGDIGKSALNGIREMVSAMNDLIENGDANGEAPSLGKVDFGAIVFQSKTRIIENSNPSMNPIPNAIAGPDISGKKASVEDLFLKVNPMKISQGKEKFTDEELRIMSEGIVYTDCKTVYECFMLLAERLRMSPFGFMVRMVGEGFKKERYMKTLTYARASFINKLEILRIPSRLYTFKRDGGNPVPMTEARAAFEIATGRMKA